MTASTQIQTSKKVNGVDVLALHDTIKAVRNDAALGKAKFRASNQWKGQALNRTTIGDFYAAGAERKHKTTFVFDNDEGEVLLGRDEGANPVEFVLHALAGCITTTTVYHAAAHGIAIRKIETTLEGDLDLQGLLAINESVKPGYEQIRVTMNIESDAPAEKIEALKKFHEYSPVLDTLRRPVDVQIKVNADSR